MQVSFIYRAKVIKSFTQDEVLSDSVNEKIIQSFSSFEVEMAKFFSKEVKALGVSGGCISFKKLPGEGSLGLIASVNIERQLSAPELSQVAEQMTEQMDEQYFGPDGLFCDIEDGGYYVLPVHPNFKTAPIETLQHENV